MYEKGDIHFGIYSIGNNPVNNPVKHFAMMKMREKR